MLAFRLLSGVRTLRFNSVMTAAAEPLADSRAKNRGTGGVSLADSAVRRLEREAFPLTIAALYAIVLLLVMPGELVQDSWATLVAGREIANHGLPHRETLTVMAHGVRWIDQQWLAQLAFYELFRAGGFRLILLTHVALIASAFGMALVAARYRGASALSVFIVGCACFFVAPWGWQLRAQSFAPLLFVSLLWLLSSDSRTPSRRVFAVLPVLVLWANLHGSVVLGAFLVALYGVLTLIGGRPRNPVKGIALLTLAPLAVVCSPYGLSLVHYYGHLLINPPFGKLVGEWRAPTPAPITALFYILAFATVWALGRWGRKLTGFERLALLVTMASALGAIRNILWFGLAALVLLPVMLDEAGLATVGRAHLAVRRVLGFAALAGLAAALVFGATRQNSWYEQLWPDRAVAAVSAATRAPSTRVFASDGDADWLLWREPQLRGRVAFDIRFELNSAAQIRSLHRYFNRIGPHWQAAARGYKVIVLDRKRYEKVRVSLVAGGQMRQTFLDPDHAVLVRSGGPPN